MVQSNKFGPLVGPEWLREHLSDGDLRVIDMRWYLGEPSRGLLEYESAHIPGAVFLDLEDVTGVGAGRHPLPSREQLQDAMRRAGVNRGDRVVVYDTSSGSVAARLWFLLRTHGHGEVAVLDGGIQAWDVSMSDASPDVSPGDFVAAPMDTTAIVSYEDVLGRDASTSLIDVRAPERFAGEAEPVDPIAGHVPGAGSVFWQRNLGSDGRFLDAQSLRGLYADVDDAIVYCGSGVNACHALLAFEVAGLRPPKLYAGSWSEWCTHEGAPVETGRDA
jgi:thiosulfate/3-mercaptopyruvate sulfurtransferase